MYHISKHIHSRGLHTLSYHERRRKLRTDRAALSKPRVPPNRSDRTRISSTNSDKMWKRRKSDTGGEKHSERSTRTEEELGRRDEQKVAWKQVLKGWKWHEGLEEGCLKDDGARDTRRYSKVGGDEMNSYLRKLYTYVEASLQWEIGDAGAPCSYMNACT